MTVGTRPSSNTSADRPLYSGAGPSAYSPSGYDPSPKGGSSAGAKYDPAPRSQGAPPPHAGNPALGIPPAGYYPPPNYYGAPGYYGPPGMYPPPMYGAPPGYGYIPSLPNHPKAVPSMVLGIVSLGVNIMGFFFSTIFLILSEGICCIIIGLIAAALGLVAVILGVMARKEIKAVQGKYSGSGLALTGIICGGIGLGLGLFMLGFAIFYLAMAYSNGSIFF